MSRPYLPTLLQLHLLTGYLGERAQLGWWPTAFYESASREQWHPKQRGRWPDDGRYEVQLPFTDSTELAMDVLRHGDQDQVMQPAELAGIVGAAHERAAARYRRAARARAGT